MVKEIYTAVGLMSGTSLDGVDASLLKTDGKNTLEPVAFYHLPYPASFKQRLMATARGDVPLSDLLRLERALTFYHAQAVKTLLQNARFSADGVDVVGFHGQTIRHLPDEGLTWQLGDASYLAEQVKIPVVADFRRRDMAAGGQGAPFAPLYHAVLLHAEPKPCAVLNLGGVANITFFDETGITAGDVGPGCSLLDQWAVKKLQQPCDLGGACGLKGTADMPWVEETFARTPFFAKSLPKSADRYDFDSCLPAPNATAENGFASLCALTALCVRQALKKAAPTHLPSSTPLWLAGGGAHNKALYKALGEYFPMLMMFEKNQMVDRLEADCFAWLAVRRLLGFVTSSPSTTGASRPTVGGVLTA